MSMVNNILIRTFGHPKGVLGKLGGMVMARMNVMVYQRAIELLDVRPHDKVLEIGFGPGVGIQLMADTVPSISITGIDPSEKMVEQAGARNADSLRAGLVDLRVGSVESLPFENAIFDKALAVNSMQIWPDAIAGLREMQRVLKPGARVVLGFTRHSGQAKAGLAEVLAAAGLADAHRVDGDGCFCVMATTSGRTVKNQQ